MLHANFISSQLLARANIAQSADEVTVINQSQAASPLAEEPFSSVFTAAIPRSNHVSDSHTLTTNASACRVSTRPQTTRNAARLEITSLALSTFTRNVNHYEFNSTLRSIHARNMPISIINSSSNSVTVDTSSTTASGNAAARTGDAETGLKPIFDKDAVTKDIAAQVQITSQFGQQASKAVGDYAQSKRNEAKTLQAESDKERQAGNTDKADQLQAQAIQINATWQEGKPGHVGLHALVGALTGNLSGALGAAATASASPILNEFQDNITQTLIDTGMSESAAKGAAKAITGVAAAGIGAVASGGSLTGAGTALNSDMNNRQLHPDERKRIKELADKKAKETCRGSADCERSANLYWTDMLQSAAEGRVDNDTAQQNNAYYNQVVNAAGIPGSEAAVTGASTAYFNNLKVAQDMLQADTGKPILMANGQVQLGTDGKPQTYFQATDAQRADPYGNIFPMGSPNSQADIVPGKDARDAQRLDRLRTLSGTATPIYPVEELLLGVRVPVKAGGAVVRTTSAVDGAALSAEQALLRSGGALDKAGQPLLDMSKLTSEQKRVAGEQLFGPDTIKQIIPDGKQIARSQGNGTNGLDDLYKVNRPDVDYVNIEYKFVGQDNKTGAQVLSTTNDGRQGSIGWISSNRRIENAVTSEAEGRAVRNAVESGRIESWVVTTRPDGSTSIQVLDSLGRPKPTDTSRIIVPSRNLSGAQR